MQRAARTDRGRAGAGAGAPARRGRDAVSRARGSRRTSIRTRRPTTREPRRRERVLADRAARVAAGGPASTDLASRMKRENVQPGKTVVIEGEPGERFYVVLSGMLEVTQAGRGQRTILKPGDYFGEVALAMDIPRTASVRAITPSTVASCDKATFDEFVRPVFAEDEPEERLDKIRGLTPVPSRAAARSTERSGRRRSGVSSPVDQPPLRPALRRTGQARPASPRPPSRRSPCP